MTFVRTYGFYQHDHLITEFNGQTARSVFRHTHGLLAQGTFADLQSSTLMAVSDTDSVMAEYNQDGVGQRTYDPYGLYPVAQDTSQAFGIQRPTAGFDCRRLFAGQRLSPVQPCAEAILQPGQREPVRARRCERLCLLWGRSLE